MENNETKEQSTPETIGQKPEQPRIKEEMGEDELEGVTGGSSTGAGAGKVTFNPFSITRKIDKASY